MASCLSKRQIMTKDSSARLHGRVSRYPHLSPGPARIYHALNASCLLLCPRHLRTPNANFHTQRVKVGNVHVLRFPLVPRTDHSLNASCPLLGPLSRALPKTYNAKACMLSAVPRDHVVYGAVQGATSYSHVPSMAGVPVHPGMCAMAAARWGMGGTSSYSSGGVWMGDQGILNREWDPVGRWFARWRCRGKAGRFHAEGLEMTVERSRDGVRAMARAQAVLTSGYMPHGDCQVGCGGQRRTQIHRRGFRFPANNGPPMHAQAPDTCSPP